MTKPFDPNDRAAIVAALEDDDQDNAIAAAIAQRLDALSKVLKTPARGWETAEIEGTKPTPGLDQIVLDLFTAPLHDQRDVVAQSRGMRPEDLSVPEIRILDHGRQ